MKKIILALSLAGLVAGTAFSVSAGGDKDKEKDKKSACCSKKDDKSCDKKDADKKSSCCSKKSDKKSCDAKKTEETKSSESSK